MEFSEVVKSGFQNYARFSGRSCRSEYWFWTLFVFIVGIVAGILDAALFATAIEDAGPLSLISNLVLILPGLAVSIRRLHDIDRSGWWFLLIFIPLLGWIVLFVWAVQKGTDGSNRFGNDPLFVMPG